MTSTWILTSSTRRIQRSCALPEGRKGVHSRPLPDLFLLHCCLLHHSNCFLPFLPASVLFSSLVLTLSNSPPFLPMTLRFRPLLVLTSPSLSLTLACMPVTLIVCRGKRPVASKEMLGRRTLLPRVQPALQVKPTVTASQLVQLHMQMHQHTQLLIQSYVLALWVNPGKMGMDDRMETAQKVMRMPP